MSKQGQTFSYKKVDGVLRPIIPIKLQKGTANTIKIMVLVDSGADVCIFWGEIGEALGIDVKTGKKHPFGGIGSTKPQIGYWHKVGLTVGSETVNADVLFSYDIAKNLAIVGQKCFFDRFIIKFNYKKSSVVLRKN
jgi:hypothetical protein